VTSHDFGQLCCDLGLTTAVQVQGQGSKLERGTISKEKERMAREQRGKCTISLALVEELPMACIRADSVLALFSAK